MISEDPNVAVSQDLEIIKYIGGGLTFDFLDSCDSTDAQHIRYHALFRMKEEEKRLENQQ